MLFQAHNIVIVSKFPKTVVGKTNIQELTKSSQNQQNNEFDE